MTALGVADGRLGGIVAWYSIIHVPQEHLPGVFAGFHRALRPGGHLLLAFAVGDGVVRRTELGGHPVSLDFYPRQPENVAELLEQSGLDVRARVVREPDDEGDFPESTPQCFLLARKSGPVR
jgi:hypothetical protein